MITRNYQILDVGLALTAEPGLFLEAFQQDYECFQVTGMPPGPRLDVRFGDNPAGPGRFLEVAGERENLEGHRHPERFAAQALVRTVMERVQAYTVLHAAVLASPGGALAISGPSGAGKTTLTLNLLNTGWSYFSDDFCPIHRTTGLVHPFPRSLWVQPEPGQAPPGTAGGPRPGKVVLPLAGSPFSIGGPPLPLKWLICLGPDEERDRAGTTLIRVNLREGAGGPLLEQLGQVEGSELREAEAAGANSWTLRFPRGQGRTRRIMDLLRQYREAWWNVYSLAATTPDFSREPTLTPMAPDAAAFFLLQELKHRMEGKGLKPGELLSHLSDLLTGVACLRMTPGRLDHSLALIQATLPAAEST